MVNAILEKYDYLATLTGTEHGCVVTLPLRTLGDPSPFREREYVMCPEQGIICILDDEMDEPIEFSCPDYAMRLTIIADIQLNCAYLGYSTSCMKICGLDGKETNLLDAIKCIELEKEDILAGVYLEAREHGFSESLKAKAEKLSVDKGFEVLKSVYAA